MGRRDSALTRPESYGSAWRIDCQHREFQPGPDNLTDGLPPHDIDRLGGSWIW